MSLPTVRQHATTFGPKTMWLKHQCWVCARRFSNNLLREDHHIIPVAFGGVNGPQVSLCSDHHSLLHKVAEILVPENTATYDDIQGFLLDLTAPEKSRILFLATRAANAERVTGRDPNRGIAISTTVPSALLKEIKTAAKVLNLSVADLTREALIEYVRRRFRSEVSSASTISQTPAKQKQ